MSQQKQASTAVLSMIKSGKINPKVTPIVNEIQRELHDKSGGKLPRKGGRSKELVEKPFEKPGPVSVRTVQTRYNKAKGNVNALDQQTQDRLFDSMLKERNLTTEVKRDRSQRQWWLDCIKHDVILFLCLSYLPT